MRPALVLAFALLLGMSLAGCSNAPRFRTNTQEVAAAPELELPDVDTEHGTDFVAVGTPTWKPGYHFRYEEEGAEAYDFAGDGFDGKEAHIESSAWGPGPGLNYTIVGNTTSFGQARYFALHRDGYAGERPELLAIEPEHLEPLEAYVGTYCAQFGSDCNSYVSVWGDEDEAPPLTFPLEDKVISKQKIDGSFRPYAPYDPVLVVTKVLGFKEVAGPFGPVQAVHVHQDYLVNFTRVLHTWQNETDPSLKDLQISGDVQATRDVYYAPALLNVVLDQAVSQGESTGSFVRDGKAQGFTESWRSWSTRRLVDVGLEETEPMSLDELAAALRSADWHPDPSAVQVRLELSTSTPNVADGETVQITASLNAGTAPHKITIKVLDAYGQEVSLDHTQSMPFTPPNPGPYLVVATAHDDAGTVLDRDSTGIYAYYQGSFEATCDPVAVDPYTGCTGVPVPMGHAIAYLFAEVTVSEPLGVLNLPGRLVLDVGNGQEVSSERQGSTATIWISSPKMEFNTDWELHYETDGSAGATIQYMIEVWPGMLPAYVYDYAFQD